MSLKNKMVIIGMGHVGAAVLNRAIAFQLVSEIAVVDIDKKKAHGEALDASHSTACNYSQNIKVYDGDYEECRDARLIIIAAGFAGRSLPPLKPGEVRDRLRLAACNIDVIRKVMREITKHTKKAVILMISNPLDITTYYAANFFDYPIDRLLGTGTTLETLRFQRILADHYRIDAKDVNGFMLGEHGKSAFAAWSLTSIRGIPIKKFEDYFQPEKPLDRSWVDDQVIRAASDIVDHKGWTNYGIAMGVCRIAKAVLFNERSILPVSTTLQGEYGIHNVALSLPCLVTENGVERRLAVSLQEDEVIKIRRSAQTLTDTLKKHDILKD
ncbi:L-lactate dehydrogenase [Anaerosinus massiliensis]|uniref:L-lactate dehydrogenase n=1 Tax=Massilibacillus massiliensis TaxID=1806837 RepID=UPI000A6FA7C1|nr:L-lactate dehydrogenase [Massilibacillus massiliensis]